MKVDAYGSLLTESATSLAASSVGANGSSTLAQTAQQASTEDTISFASVRFLTDAAFNTPSRIAKIAILQQAVSSGQYSVEPARLAAAISQADV